MTDILSLEQKPAHVLRNHNFRLLWIGEGISLLGDQFYLIALPWLVLSLTGNPLAVGTVLAMAGIPRALFMLVGGALTDRFTPRKLMINSNLARMILTGLLAALVMANLIQLWMLYVSALLFGFVDAFFFPAQTSIVPKLLDKNQLQAGNALIHGTAQLSLFVGPLAAGAAISQLDRGAHSTTGIALSFALDSLSFVASIAALSLMRIHNGDTGAAKAPGGVLGSIRAGLSYVWHDPTLRIVFPITMGLNILINGPFAVGIPVISRTRFPEGAAAFGLIMSLFGGGALTGTLLAGVLPKLSKKWLGTVSLSVISLMGVGLAVIGLSSTMYVAAVSALVMGIANGYANINLITWLQQKVAPEMTGRVMSLVMFAAIGLNPISTALAGALIGLNLTVLLVCAGLLMTAFTLSAAFSPAVRAGME
ncbi:MAG TPA: MFS transporter [Anaerolineales bacterium]|jgi:MFS family permease|nr:MFS transporter [Anaerolineae bacterium]HRJ56608.1 MFS transporter [Anaerolineales bacterium]HRK87654.1 MFS transporter [Anaerolineales bacterium]